MQFQRAAGVHAAAKETISLAEERFLDNRGEWQFDNAWQEMLNHATVKVSVSSLECLAFSINICVIL